MNSKIIEKALRGEFVLIAEIGVNYYDIASIQKITPLSAAKLMVKKAKTAGATAVKFQTYKAENLTVKSSPSYWDTREEKTTSQYELFKKYDSFSLFEYEQIAAYCSELDIEFLSTPFDFYAVDYLDSLMSVYKISSSDLTNLPFISYQAKKGKPILLSTGAANDKEIDKAIETIRLFNTQAITLLHCVLEYPTPYENANLNRISALKERYPNLIIGYSDHTKPDNSYDVIKTAFNLGANIIEKHFTLDKNLTGNDHYHAIDDLDVEKIMSEMKFISSIRGSYSLEHSENERTARENARRSLISKINILAGETITEEMITFKRPGTGISPANLDKLIGRIAKVEIEKDTILRYDMFKD